MSHAKPLGIRVPYSEYGKLGEAILVASNQNFKHTFVSLTRKPVPIRKRGHPLLRLLTWCYMMTCILVTYVENWFTTGAPPGFSIEV